MYPCSFTQNISPVHKIMQVKSFSYCSDHTSKWRKSNVSDSKHGDPGVIFCCASLSTSRTWCFLRCFSVQCSYKVWGFFLVTTAFCQLDHSGHSALISLINKQNCHYRDGFSFSHQYKLCVKILGGQQFLNYSNQPTTPPPTVMLTPPTTILMFDMNST